MVHTQHGHTRGRSPSPSLATAGQGSSPGPVGSPAGTSHTAHQQTSQDLGISPVPPIQAVLVSYGIWVCFVFFPRDQDTAWCVDSSTYSPAQHHFSWKASKRGSNESNCFPLSPNLSRRQVWAHSAIPKEKNHLFQ